MPAVPFNIDNHEHEIENSMSAIIITNCFKSRDYLMFHANTLKEGEDGRLRALKIADEHDNPRIRRHTAHARVVDIVAAGPQLECQAKRHQALVNLRVPSK